MKNKGLNFILVCLFIMILTGTGRAFECEDLVDALDRCGGGVQSGMQVDFDDCAIYTTKNNCESNGCIWWSAKDKCLPAICHTDSNFSGIPNVSEFIMWKHETGRKCPESSCNSTFCLNLGAWCCQLGDGSCRCYATDSACRLSGGIVVAECLEEADPGGEFDCWDLYDAYLRCDYNSTTCGRNVDFDDCNSYTTEYLCEIAGCIWWDTKNKCLPAICHTDSNFSGMPNVSEFIMWKHETGRKCPQESCYNDICQDDHGSTWCCCEYSDGCGCSHATNYCEPQGGTCVDFCVSYY